MNPVTSAQIHGLADCFLLQDKRVPTQNPRLATATSSTASVPPTTVTFWLSEPQNPSERQEVMDLPGMRLSVEVASERTVEMSPFTFPTIQNFKGSELISSLVAFRNFKSIPCRHSVLQNFMTVMQTVPSLTKRFTKK